MASIHLASWSRTACSSGRGGGSAAAVAIGAPAKPASRAIMARLRMAASPRPGRDLYGARERADQSGARPRRPRKRPPERSGRHRYFRRSGRSVLVAVGLLLRARVQALGGLVAVDELDHNQQRIVA